ncbi:hypothetical protein UlMin_015745 [Ulmus minor]
MSSSRFRNLSKISVVVQPRRHFSTSSSSTSHPESNWKPIKTTFRLKPTLSELDDYLYRCNNEIMKLGRLGRVEEARKVFDRMPQRDVFSYASAITVYLKNDNLPNAEKLFWAMPEHSVVAGSAMINAYMKAGRIDEARQVFDLMDEKNVYSWTSLISGYFNCGLVEEALRLFDQMPEKNVVSWTTVVLGYARNGLIDEARKAFDLMPERNIVAWTAMIKAYVENDRFGEAHQLFDEMPERNLYSWNTMISGCLNANRVSQGIELFNSMPQRNTISWTIMVSGLARNKKIKLARSYFDKMPYKDVAAWNAMISAYVEEGLMVEANALFVVMPEKSIVTWNAMFDGYAKTGPEGEALKHLILMLRSHFRPNGRTLCSTLSSCNGMLELMQVHSLLISLGFEHNTSLTNVLVSMYSRSGDIHSARLAFDHLRTKDVVSWNSMTLAYSRHGHGHHALQVFARMLRSGAKPDEVTFVGILSACNHAGLVKKGQRFFNSMDCVYGLEPKAEHYSCLIDILGRAGHVDEAAKVLSEMSCCEQDGVVLGALLGACKLHGDFRLASSIGEKVLEMEPTSSGGYVLLANLYAAHGKWDKFAQLRKKMKESNVKKVPGFSHIEVKGKSNVFYSGDRSHPQIEEVYGLLKEKLFPQLREVGHIENN